MKLTFLGTRGGIKVRSQKHYRHSSMLVSYYNAHILIDWGSDWLSRPLSFRPDAILLTHAHPDHAEGLKQGSPYKVYATNSTWNRIKTYPIETKHTVIAYKPFTIRSFVCTAYPVRHSLNAPAVGYKIQAGKRTIFYAPDLVSIIKRHKALKNCDAYIGDGAIIERSLLVRKRSIGKGRTTRIGHSPITEQLKWCAQEGVNHVIITHCGSEIVTTEAQQIEQKLQALAKEYGVKVTLAYDGMTITI